MRDSATATNEMQANGIRAAYEYQLWEEGPRPCGSWP